MKFFQSLAWTVTLVVSLAISLNTSARTCPQILSLTQQMPPPLAPPASLEEVALALEYREALSQRLYAMPERDFAFVSLGLQKVHGPQEGREALVTLRNKLGVEIVSGLRSFYAVPVANPKVVGDIASFLRDVARESLKGLGRDHGLSLYLDPKTGKLLTLLQDGGWVFGGQPGTPFIRLSDGSRYIYYASLGSTRVHGAVKPSNNELKNLTTLQTTYGQSYGLVVGANDFVIYSPTEALNNPIGLLDTNVLSLWDGF